MEILDKSIGEALHGPTTMPYCDWRRYRAMGLDLAQQVIAEVGPSAAVFPSA